MKTPTWLVFPSICADLGGAEHVHYSSRFAYIKLPGEAAEVKLPRASLPAPDKWTAFTLADAAKQPL